MNVSMMPTLVAGDAGGNAAAPANKDEAGEGFGVAVKDAEQQHGAKAKSTEGDGRQRTEGRTKNGEAVEGDGDASDGKAADDADASATAGDVLGRMLSASFLSSYGQLPAGVSGDAGKAGGETAADGEGALGGELEERIVISTIADLAGSQSEDEPKRIALRVTGMETHFEPHQNAPKLVDVEPTAVVAMAEAGAGQGRDGVRTPFAEILQRLKTERSDKTAPAAQSDGSGEGRASDEKAGSEAAPTHETARRSGANRSEAGGAKPWTPPGIRADVANEATAGGGQTTGQIINAQLAERIIGAFADQPAPTREPSAAPQSANVQMLRLTAGGAALKTLSIQLEPQNLGRVDVSMRLVDGRLTVELAASEPSTAATLAGDRQGLRKILEHAGFALDDAAITIVARDGNPLSSAPASNGDAGAGRQSSPQGQAFGSPDGNRRETERRSEDQGRRERSEAPAEEPPATARRGNSVYL